MSCQNKGLSPELSFILILNMDIMTIPAITDIKNKALLLIYLDIIILLFPLFRKVLPFLKAFH